MSIPRCITLIAMIVVGVASSTNAAPMQGSGWATEAPELPLIPLEKSLIPFSPLELDSGTISSKDNYHALANALVRGLLIANRTGEIGYEAPLSYRIQDLVRGLRRGEALMRASLQAGVPFHIVHRLLKLGTCGSDIN